MPDEYGFLKYGKPLVAAAPILIGLNMLPSTAHACTGSANDPIFCFNNDGQVVNGFTEFYTGNLQGIPGASSVPGDTGPLVTPGFDHGASVTNTTTGAAAPLSVPGIGGTPQLPGSDTSDATKPGRDPIVDYFVTTPGYGDSNTVIIAPASGGIGFTSTEGKLPAGFGEMIELVDDDDAGPSLSEGCLLSSQACQQQVSEFYIQVAPALAPEYSAGILDAVVDDDDNDLGLDADQFFVFDQRNSFEQDSELANALVESLNKEFGPRVEISGDGFGAVDDDDNNIYSSLRSGSSFNVDDDDNDTYSSIVVNRTNDDDGNGGPSVIRVPANEPNPAERQLASLQRLRDRAAAETDPQKKQELEQRVARFENLISSFGSSALKAGLHNQDTQTTPLPGRN